MVKKKPSPYLSSLPAMSYVLLMIIVAIVVSCSVVHCDSPVQYDTTVAHPDGAREGSAPPAPGGRPPSTYFTVPPPPQRRRLLHTTGRWAGA
ncbi:hypothetical protein BS78_03G092800 [Paspalum vaginatum]|nr:hypothetical protein BS78_03G092800 [Paspalum vaginatum]